MVTRSQEGGSQAGGSRPPITIGRQTGSPVANQGLAVVSEDRRLKRHGNRPWLRAYVARQLNEQISSESTSHSGLARIADDALARHSFLCGSTGMGKSRLGWHVIGEQLRSGCSVVAMDPKGDSFDHLLAHAIAGGIPPERVVILDPRQPAGMPVVNLLTSRIPLGQAVGDFVALVLQSAKSTGPRMADLLVNGLILVGSQPEPSLYEFARFLVRDDYREALLRTPIQPPDPVAYEEARTYFAEEFGVWSRSERSGAVSPVMNKIREILRNRFLLPLLCGRGQSLDLSRLWREQWLVFVRLDRTALGDEGVRLLAGILTNLLFRTALRSSGPVPVLLCLDELPQVERFVGGAIADIITVARSQNLRCLVACQHLEQLSDSLRSTLLANCAVQSFFRIGHADARLAAASLAAGTESRATRVTVDVAREDRKTGEVERSEWRQPICDAFGQPLRCDPLWWSCEPPSALQGPAALRSLARYTAVTGVARLYVHAADTGEPVELGAYVAGLQTTEYAVEGPGLQLVVRFPRPRVTRSERTSESEAVRAWTRCLETLPVQHTVLRLAGQPAGVVKVANVTTPQVKDGEREAFLAASVAANGQAEDEIAAMLAWRRRQVDLVAQGPATWQEADDGSLA